MPRASCRECGCSSCQEINRLEGPCDQCDHCQRSDGGPHNPQTPRNAEAKRPEQLNQTPKAPSVGASVASIQKENADRRFLKANPSLKLPAGIDGVCVITLQFEPGGSTEMCHVVAKKKDMDHQKLTHVEFLWGMGYKKFHINTSRNLFRLSAELHRTFDEGSWALLPIDFTILSSMQARYKKWPTDPNHEMTQGDYQGYKFEKALHYGKKKSFKYVFLPLSSPRFQMPITRLKPPLVVPPTAADAHFFPYTTLPVLTLHIEPHYAIWNLGHNFKERRLTSTYISDDPALARLVKYELALEASLSIFEVWYKVKTPSWFHGDDDDEDDDNKSESDPSAGGPSRGTRAQKRRRTEDRGGDSSSIVSASSGYNVSEGAGGEPMEDVESDLDSTDDESLDEGEDDFMETEEELSNRIDGWRGEVAIYNGSDDQGNSGSVMDPVPPCSGDLAEPKINDFETTRIAAGVV